VIDEFLQQQRSSGTLDSAGAFAIDVKAAVRKLGQYLLADADQALLKLVQFGVARQCAALTVVTTPQGYCLHFLGLHEPQSAAQLLAALGEVTKGQDLVTGLQFFLAREADVLVAHWKAGALVDAATTETDGASTIDGHPDARFPDTLSLELRFPPKADLVFHPSELKRHLAACPMLVSLDKHKLNQVVPNNAGFESFTQLVFDPPLLEDRPTFSVQAYVEELTEPRPGPFMAEVIPVKRGVALAALYLPAAAPGIRLFVEANEVETVLNTLELQPGPAWLAREKPLRILVHSLSEKIHTTALRANRQPSAFWTWLRRGLLVGVMALVIWVLLYGGLFKGGVSGYVWILVGVLRVLWAIF
jgi:hypothetical protein